MLKLDPIGSSEWESSFEQAPQISIRSVQQTFDNGYVVAAAIDGRPEESVDSMPLSMLETTPNTNIPEPTTLFLLGLGVLGLLGLMASKRRR